MEMQSRQLAYVSIKLRREVWAGDKHVGVIVVAKVFKALRLDELTWQEFEKELMET